MIKRRLYCHVTKFPGHTATIIKIIIVYSRVPRRSDGNHIGIRRATVLQFVVIINTTVQVLSFIVCINHFLMPNKIQFSAAQL